MKIIILALLMVSLLPYTVQAEYSCNSYVQKNGETIQVNPSPINVEGVGTINSFTESDGIVRVIFTDKNLRVDQPFNFTVECTNGTDFLRTTKTITPKEAGLESVADRMVWLKENAAYIVGVGLVLSMTVGFLLWLISWR